jgi:ADP-heptose:LPS heptosyltransferase/SAM-dependent methyltransferase
MIDRPRIGSILLIKVDHIGDFVLGFDALIALRQAFPYARIDLLCAPWNEELARSLAIFDNVHTVTFFSKRADGEPLKFNPETLSEVAHERFDLAIDLRVDHDSRVLLRHVQATFKAGFDSIGNNEDMIISLPHYIPDISQSNIGVHQSLLMLRLIRSVADVFNRTDGVRSLLLDRVAQATEIDLSVASGRVLVMCNTSSGRAVKNWPLERFRRLIRWLAIEMDAVVLLIGTNDQMAETQDIIQFCGSENVISAVGKTSIRQATSLVAKASLFIGNDSALTHIAARIGVPVIALFSGIDPTAMWAPVGQHTTILRAPVPCSNCHILSIKDCYGDHACILNISEEAVRSALRKFLIDAPCYGDPAPAADSGLASLRTEDAFCDWIASRQEQWPQRFSDNCRRYAALPGALPIDKMLRSFVANNQNNRGDLNRFFALALIFDQLVKEQVSGDIAELGVYKGNTAAMLAELARRLGTTVYLLDTFEGFDAADLAGVDANKRMEFTDTSLEQVRSLVGDTSVRYIKGFFPNTAGQIQPDARFSLVHIDCDLYAPFKAALAFFYDRLLPGGFLIMHDYSSLHWDGAERAVDEFFADKPESVVPLPDGSGTVVVRKIKLADRFDNWFVQDKTSGFANAWVTANHAGVKSVLASGWSEPEAWGTWGLGYSHVLCLFLAHPPRGDIELAVEATAVLLPGRERLTVEVFANGEQVTIWEFNEAVNTGVRRVTIPHCAIHLREGLPVFEVEFRPSSAEPPHALNPDIPDERPLGLGLVRFRQRQI